MEFDETEILRTFAAEAEELLAQMEGILLELEDRTDDDEILAALFRTAHTIKGNAMSLQLAAVAELAHAVEDVLHGIRERRLTVTSELISLLLTAGDALRHMIPEAIAGLPSGDVRGLVAQLAAAAAPSTRPAPCAGAAHATGNASHEPTSADRTRSLRVDLDKLDRLLNITGEIAIARGRLRQLLDSEPNSQVFEVFSGADRLLGELQQLVMDVRLVPLKPAFRQYMRTVRDTAAACNKQAVLRIEGDDIEVDNTVIDGLRDPLIHLVRNAIAHGIEPPDVRVQHGKPACGGITLRTRREAGGIVLQVSDDGAGLDRKRIAARAVSEGITATPETLPDHELLELVFRPGFTTTDKVSDLSGRGVGMDAVRRGIEALRGSISIDSTSGHGATFTIRLPLTVAIVDGFVVSVGDETFVLPMGTVSECLQLPADMSWDAEGRSVLSLREEPLPILGLRRFFDVPGNATSRQHVLVVRDETGAAGLVVDALQGESQAVIKPLGALLRGRPCIAGSTILGNGRVALILDVPLLLREALTRAPLTRSIS